MNRQIELPVRTLSCRGPESLKLNLAREWLFTNGLGGYASGTVANIPTRRFHGLLISALPAPMGRTLMLTHVSEQIRLPDNTTVRLGGLETVEHGLQESGLEYLVEFRLEGGLPTWRYEIGPEHVLEKQVLLPYEQNTVHLTYRLVAGPGAVRIKIMPRMQFRRHEGRLDASGCEECEIVSTQERYEIRPRSDLQIPPLRFHLHGEDPALTLSEQRIPNVLYRIEQSRGYDHVGELWSPGYFRASLTLGESVTLMASTEAWDTLLALKPDEAVAAYQERSRRLIQAASARPESPAFRELVLAADQFVITPVTRAEERPRARAAGDEVRTVIAGYHWFTDWGRDTMISLEGLTLATGRVAEAGAILRTFAHHVRDGLIPNLFPEGESEGLYHTADASLWFFHALDRYLAYSDDSETLRSLLPTLNAIYAAHLKGTHFGIGVDPADGLLHQGAEGYQLTWMDAKVGDWVVTPRRGKAVEINALWYNALCLLAGWLAEDGQEGAAADVRATAERVRESFNARFWCAERQYLYDVIDGPGGNEASLRPNQLFAISLPHPVLQKDRWEPVFRIVTEQLLTPVGLRSLARGHPDYKSRYFGDLRDRDAAYHQGTVWGWLIGPYIDALLKVRPEEHDEVRRLLDGLEQHLSEGCIGSIAEIFDAEAPYTPRGCIAQAWSVAEVLRCHVASAPS